MELGDVFRTIEKKAAVSSSTAKCFITGTVLLAVSMRVVKGIQQQKRLYRNPVIDLSRIRPSGSMAAHIKGTEDLRIFYAGCGSNVV